MGDLPTAPVRVRRQVSPECRCRFTDGGGSRRRHRRRRVVVAVRRSAATLVSAGQLTLELVQVGVPGAVLQVACDLRLLGLCTAAPHSVDPLAQVNRVRSVAPTDQSSVIVVLGYPERGIDTRTAPWLDARRGPMTRPVARSDPLESARPTASLPPHSGCYFTSRRELAHSPTMVGSTIQTPIAVSVSGSIPCRSRSAIRPKAPNTSSQSRCP